MPARRVGDRGQSADSSRRRRPRANLNSKRVGSPITEPFVDDEFENSDAT